VLIKGRDTQRLDRVVLALAGRRVGCTIKFCDVVRTRCDECPMLERGWNGLRVMF
jgi:UDP-N-acetylmuramoyl-tripeptide--D-alanyl-D-alanine ligase